MWLRIRTNHAAQSRRLGPRTWLGALDLRLGERGFTTFGGVLVFITIAAGAGLTLMIQSVHSITHDQIALDRCTGEALLKLRAATVTMEHSYQRLEGYRLAVIASLFSPAALELFRKAAYVEQLIQKNAKALWQAEEAQWNHTLFLRCHVSWGVTGNTLPPFPFDIVDPNLGLLDLKRIQKFVITPSPIVLKITYGKLSSVAKMEKKKPFGWKVAWTQ